MPERYGELWSGAFSIRKNQTAGSVKRHTVVVKLVKYLLPIVALGVVGLILAWPYLEPETLGFHIGFASLEIDDSNDPAMVNPRYVGTDDEEQPFTITADVAKALALGADAVSIGSAAMIAIGDNDPKWEKDYIKLGTTAGAYDDWHEGNDPAGISTQNKKLMKRLNPIKAGKKLTNYLKVMTLEAQTLARACGKNSLHNLEPEDLCALTLEAAAMARVPLAGSSWIPGINEKK